MKITDKDFDEHMRWVKDREALRDMVAYLKMGGYPFSAENPIRGLQWVALMMEQDKVWDWESRQWVKEKRDELG